MDMAVRMGMGMRGGPRRPSFPICLGEFGPLSYVKSPRRPSAPTLRRAAAGRDWRWTCWASRGGISLYYYQSRSLQRMATPARTCTHISSRRRLANCREPPAARSLTHTLSSEPRGAPSHR